MSLAKHWERKARHRQQIALFAKLRRSFDSEIDHIHIREVVRTDDFVTPFGNNAPLCLTEPLGVKVIRLHPYVASSPRLCRDCEARMHRMQRS